MEGGYSEELKTKCLQQIEERVSIRRVARDNDVPESTIRAWMFTKQVTDDEIRQAFREFPGDPAAVAKHLDITPQALNHRLREMEKAGAALQPEVTSKAIASVFDVQANLEAQNSRCVTLLETCKTPMEKNAVERTLLAINQQATRVLETLYDIEQIQAFQNEVLEVIDSFEPGKKQQVLQALRERRTLRSAFVSSNRAGTA